MRLAEIIEYSLTRGAELEAPVLTRRFRLFLLSRQWPENVVNYLSIKQEDGRYTVSFPNWLEKQVDLKENGDQNNPPAGDIRDFLTNYIGIDDASQGFMTAMAETGI